MRSGLFCLVFALAASPLSAGDFDPGMEPLYCGIPVNAESLDLKPGGAVVSVVADAVAWSRLLSNVVSHPTQVQTLAQGVTTYKIYTVATRLPVKGQKCQNGTEPYNSLFFSKPMQGAGGEIYPVRFSLVCRDESGIKDSLYVDADAGGAILDMTFYNGSLGLLIPPMSEKRAASKYGLDAFLNRMVNHFTDIASGE